MPGPRSPSSAALTGCLLLALSASACQSTPPPPRAGLEAVETKLIDARAIDCTFEIRSTGAVRSELRGTLKIDRAPGDDRVALQAHGTFAGRTVSITLNTSGDQLVGGTNPDHELGKRPAELVDAIVVGWVRMGLLHNLAMLSGNAPPDHADGGVREWVVPTDVERATDGRAYRFGIDVDGEPSGRVELELTASGLPIERRQKVEFANGTMEVVERYIRCALTED